MRPYIEEYTLLSAIDLISVSEGSTSHSHRYQSPSIPRMTEVMPTPTERSITPTIPPPSPVVKPSSTPSPPPAPPIPEDLFYYGKHRIVTFACLFVLIA
jgi:hypothetical protein